MNIVLWGLGWAALTALVLWGNYRWHTYLTKAAGGDAYRDGYEYWANEKTEFYALREWTPERLDRRR